MDLIRNSHDKRKHIIFFYLSYFFQALPTKKSVKKDLLNMEFFSDEIKHFIKNTPWIFAKTYAETWPHEYIVQEKVDNNLYLKLAHHIDTFGYEKYFYKKKMTYFDYNGYVYWHMENIINRCISSETYWKREKEGRLPESF